MLDFSSNSYLHLGDISIGKSMRLVAQWREVSHDLVHRDASWESDSLLHVLGLLASVGLLALLLDHLIDLLAHGVDVGPRHAKFDSLGEARYIKERTQNRRKNATYGDWKWELCAYHQ